MISLKRYLERGPEKLPQLCADAHVTMLEAIAAGALRCCPPTGGVLERELSVAAGPLKHDRSPRVLKSCQQKALKAIHAWGEESEAYFTRKTAEVKEMLTELANTAESIGKRDRRYTQQFHEITSSLQTIAQLDDLGRIKSCVLSSAGELKGCIDRMVREGNESIAQLEASLASHRVALDQARELASLDPLTGLYNRREVEARLARRVTDHEPFCVVIVDLNNFKRINDQHGHLAGDELLRQIAHELRMASRAQDVLGRWGGDEFVMVIDGNFTNTKIKIQRMRPWVFGNYEIDLAGTKQSIVVSASIGMAEWAPGETILQVLKRADADMYRDKGVRS